MPTTYPRKGSERRVGRIFRYLRDEVMVVTSKQPSRTWYIVAPPHPPTPAAVLHRMDCKSHDKINHPLPTVEEVGSLNKRINRSSVASVIQMLIVCIARMWICWWKVLAVVEKKIFEVVRGLTMSFSMESVKKA